MRVWWYVIHWLLRDATRTMQPCSQAMVLRSDVVVVTHAKGAFDLVGHRTVALVRVARDSVSRLLGVRLFALRLSRGSEAVGVALEFVAHVLRGRLLRVGLHGSGELVGGALAVGVGHDD